MHATAGRSERSPPWPKEAWEPLVAETLKVRTNRPISGVFSGLPRIQSGGCSDAHAARPGGCTFGADPPPLEHTSLSQRLLEQSNPTFPIGSFFNGHR
jgi:hypothetical protein